MDAHLCPTCGAPLPIGAPGTVDRCPFCKAETREDGGPGALAIVPSAPRAPTGDDDPEPPMNLGAALGRLQLRHGDVLVRVCGLAALVGAAFAGASFLARASAPARHRGHGGFGDAWPLGVVFIVAGLLLTYNFRKVTRGRLAGGSVQGSFRWRDLRELDMREIDLGQCMFDHADLSRARLDDSEVTQCHFNRASLRGTSLARSTFTQCEFNRSDLTGASFDGATFTQCKFRGAELDGVSLRGTTFRQCDLRGTAVAQAKDHLEGASLEQCTT